jgi:hypothetical protein
MLQRQEHYLQLDENLRKLGQSIPGFGEKFSSAFAEFLAEQEFGLAFELIVYFIEDNSIIPNVEAQKHIIFLSEAMDSKGHTGD